jgi:hypothetical protein
VSINPLPTTYLNVRRFVPDDTIFFRPVGNQPEKHGLADEPGGRFESKLAQ